MNMQMQRARHVRLTAVAAIGAAVSLAGLNALWAQSPSGQADAGQSGQVTVKQRLAQLASADYLTRQAASRALFADPKITDDQLIELYAAANLPEQRHRLLAVAQHHVLRNRRKLIDRTAGDGSLGIAHQGVTKAQLPHLGRPAIRVLDTLAGFPAHAVLEPGDLILLVDGRKLPEVNDGLQIREIFRTAILARKPNSLVRLKVRRRDVMIDVRIRIASGQALDRMYNSNDQTDLPVLDAQSARDWTQFRQKLEGVKAAKTVKIEAAAAGE